MKFKATQAEIGDQEARRASQKALNRRSHSLSRWKPASPRHCTSYGCEELQTHDLVFRNYYRDGSPKMIGYCRAHVWKVQMIFRMYREGCYVHPRET